VADEATLAGVLEDLGQELGEAFAALWQGLSDSDRRALVVVASAPGSRPRSRLWRRSPCHGKPRATRSTDCSTKATSSTQVSVS